MKYTLIRLTPQGFKEHKNVTSTRTCEGKIHTTMDGELYAYTSPTADTLKLKAVMLNTAIGAAQKRIKAAQSEIEVLRDLRP